MLDHYKGYTWKSYTDLSRKLGKSNYYVCSWLQKYKGKTVYDCIDATINKNNLNTYKSNKDKTVYDCIDAVTKTDTYRGYTWNSYADLSRQLGKGKNYVYKWLNDHKGKTVYDCIDTVIDENNLNTYRGYTWKSHSDLSRQLSKPNNYVYLWLKNHKGKTVYDCIDAVIDGSYTYYRDYKWKSYVDLSRQLGKKKGYVCNWLQKYKGKTVYDCIDTVIDENNLNTYRGYTWKSHSDLSRQLNISKQALSFWLKNHKDKTAYDYIDYYLDASSYKDNEYKILYEFLNWGSNINKDDLSNKEYIEKLKNEIKLDMDKIDFMKLIENHVNLPNNIVMAIYHYKEENMPTLLKNALKVQRWESSQFLKRCIELKASYGLSLEGLGFSVYYMEHRFDA